MGAYFGLVWRLRGLVWKQSHTKLSGPGLGRSGRDQRGISCIYFVHVKPIFTFDGAAV